MLGKPVKVEICGNRGEKCFEIFTIFGTLTSKLHLWFIFGPISLALQMLKDEVFLKL